MRLWPMLHWVVMAVLLGSPGTARAHNEAVHQAMTDLAYHVLLLGRQMTEEPATVPERTRLVLDRLRRDDPDVARLFADAGPAVERLRAVRADLGPPRGSCFPPAARDATMGAVRLAVTINYGYQDSGCELDTGYRPPELLRFANGRGLDLTGVTFGYWAASPDRRKQDWVLNATTLAALTQAAAVVAGASTTASVATLCLGLCTFFPPACIACSVLAVGAGGAVIDKVTSFDATALDSLDYVGFGHFIDMKPMVAGPDVRPGKAMLAAGPIGVPDPIEAVVIALFDLAGTHLNHGASQGPKNYEIAVPDGHPLSLPRTALDWEAPTLTQLTFTPVDNLAAHGYRQASLARGGTGEASNLGGVLHALGDASVPMHVVGASGYGHRPYEDAVEAAFPELTGAGAGDPTADIIALVRSTARWYRTIRDRQAALGTSAVPVRDLVTAVAASTLATASANPAVYRPDLSLTYVIDEDAAIAGYDTPALRTVQRATMFEGISASAAFLLSWTRVP